MNETLAIKIKEKIENQRLSVNALEKEAGLKPQALRNILLGRSKNPGASALKAIARVLGCSVDELLGEDIDSQSQGYNQEFKIQNSKLFRDTCAEVINLFETHRREFTEKEFSFVVREAYIYSLERNSEKLDKKFAAWLYEKNFN